MNYVCSENFELLQIARIARFSARQLKKFESKEDHFRQAFADYETLESAIKIRHWEPSKKA